MRLIDADALIENIKHGLWDWETVDGITATTVLKQTIQDIRNEPTIDAEPVIRCKDCKWFAINGIEGATIDGKPLRYAVCTHYHGMRGITAYAYCSRAERKNDEVN